MLAPLLTDPTRDAVPIRAYNEVMTSTRTDQLLALGAVAVPLVAAAALVPLRDEVANANVALVLVVAVVAFASSGRRLAAGLAAVAAATGFNLFHTQPYLSLRISSV